MKTNVKKLSLLLALAMSTPMIISNANTNTVYAEETNRNLELSHTINGKDTKYIKGRDIMVLLDVSSSNQGNYVSNLEALKMFVENLNEKDNIIFFKYGENTEESFRVIRNHTGESSYTNKMTKSEAKEFLNSAENIVRLPFISYDRVPQENQRLSFEEVFEKVADTENDNVVFTITDNYVGDTGVERLDTSFEAWIKAKAKVYYNVLVTNKPNTETKAYLEQKGIKVREVSDLSKSTFTTILKELDETTIVRTYPNLTFKIKYDETKIKIKNVRLQKSDGSIELINLVNNEYTFKSNLDGEYKFMFDYDTNETLTEESTIQSYILEEEQIVQEKSIKISPKIYNAIIQYKDFEGKVVKEERAKVKKGEKPVIVEGFKENEKEYKVKENYEVPIIIEDDQVVEVPVVEIVKAIKIENIAVTKYNVIIQYKDFEGKVVKEERAKVKKGEKPIIVEGFKENEKEYKIKENYEVPTITENDQVVEVPVVEIVKAIKIENIAVTKYNVLIQYKDFEGKVVKEERAKVKKGEKPVILEGFKENEKEYKVKENYEVPTITENEQVVEVPVVEIVKAIKIENIAVTKYNVLIQYKDFEGKVVKEERAKVKKGEKPIIVEGFKENEKEYKVKENYEVPIITENEQVVEVPVVEIVKAIKIEKRIENKKHIIPKTAINQKNIYIFLGVIGIIGVYITKKIRSSILK